MSFFQRFVLLNGFNLYGWQRLIWWVFLTAIFCLLCYVAFHFVAKAW